MRDTRHWIAQNAPGDGYLAPGPGCSLQPYERSRDRGGCSNRGLPLEHAGPSTRADELGERHSRVPLYVGFAAAAMLALIALVAFPPYRADVLLVLPWIVLAFPLHRAMESSTSRRRASRKGASPQWGRQDGSRGVEEADPSVVCRTRSAGRTPA